MTELAKHALLTAGGLVLVGLPLLANPGPAAELYRKLPRHAWAGRLLSALALAWGGRMIYLMPFEFLQPYRGLILPAIPVIILLSWFCMEEMLSARSLGGLMALLPSPVLAAVRPHPSSWRIAVTLTAYFMVLAGMTLIMCPYLLRDALGWMAKTPRRSRVCGLLASLHGIILGVLGLLVY